MNIDILGWAASFGINDRPWLLLGKGPSFSKVRNLELEQYFTCTLNHVIRQVPATVAHIIDIDVVIDCADAIDANARFLVMPYRPHIDCRPTNRTLIDLASEIPVLRKLSNERRLIWYNASTSRKPPYGNSPTIDVKYFSAEAALNVLATCGVKVVRSLGVDGGSTYSNEFSDLKDKTLLANGHESFGKQFEGISSTIRKTGISYAPLYAQAPIKIFVGTDRAQMAGVKVLEYSIKKFATMSVQVEPIDDRAVPVPADPSNRTKTGFSFSRYLIPELCGYQGRGIYFDADMQVFTDVTKLWTKDFSGAHVLYAEGPPDKSRPPLFSVLLLDCEQLRWDVRDIIGGLDQGRYSYKQLMGEMCIVPPEKKRAGLAFEWNSLEYFEAGRTCLIHYTDMPTQPWISSRNRYGKQWYACLRDAIDEGFLTPEFLYDEVARGHVSPELPRWIGLQDPPQYKELKRDWTPPYRRFVKPLLARAPSTHAASGDNGSRASVRSSWLPKFRQMYARLRKQVL
jgi:hypothetical protein